MLGNQAVTMFGPFGLFLTISPTLIPKLVKELKKAGCDFIYISSFRKNQFPNAE